MGDEEKDYLYKRVREKVKRGTDLFACWTWTGTIGKDGYGRICIKRKSYIAHRLVFEMLQGPIPPGKYIDHLCRNRGCVNPAHLEPVTNGENVLRGVGITAQLKRMTHYRLGHPLVQTKNQRRCDTCVKAARKRRWAEHGT